MSKKPCCLKKINKNFILLLNLAEYPVKERYPSCLLIYTLSSLTPLSLDVVDDYNRMINWITIKKKEIVKKTVKLQYSVYTVLCVIAGLFFCFFFPRDWSTLACDSVFEKKINFAQQIMFFKQHTAVESIICTMVALMIDKLFVYTTFLSYNISFYSLMIRNVTIVHWEWAENSLPTNNSKRTIFFARDNSSQTSPSIR